MDTIYTFQQLRGLLSPLFRRYGIRRAVLFGSYAKGQASEQSDIDLLVDSGLSGLRFVGFLDDVQNAVGKEVGLFDIRHIEKGSPIDREIRATGVTMYEQ